MSEYYILRDGEPVLEPSYQLYALWFEENKDARQIAVDEVAGARVSTCFLGLDHRWGEGAPVLFETLVFDGPLDGEQERYATREEAMEGHKKMVERLTVKNISLDEAKAKVAGMPYDSVKAVLRSHGVELWLDNEPIVRLLLAEKIEGGQIADPTNASDTVMSS